MEKLKRILVTLCFFLAITFVLQAAAYCQDAPPVICEPRISLDLGGGLSKPIPYCRNYSLDAPNSSIERAVIVIHGVDRNAVDYYNYVVTGAVTVSASSETIIVAPQFLLQSDVTSTGQDVVFWANDGEGWSRGDHSCTGDGTCGGSGAGTISSFTVIDRILETLSDRVKFPNLTRIVIAGHSAGGQFVNRFAGGSQAEGQLKRKHINIRYIVSNPSSYLYFSKERWDDKSDKRLFQYKVPDQAAVTGCPGYNDYRYGFDNLNNYMAATGPRKIPGQYRRRKIVYLLGGADTDGPNLDTSCEANFQGSFRLMRGYVFYNYLYHYYGAAGLPNQSVVTVPGVAHVADEMFNSDCGLLCLFDKSVVPAPSCGHICGQ